MASTTLVLAEVRFALTVLNDVLDEFSARMDALGFRVEDANLETGVVTVDASSDPDDYSVLMAACDAAQAVGINADQNVIEANIKE